MLAEIYLLKLEAAVRAAKEAATTASTSRFVPVTLPAAKAPNSVEIDWGPIKSTFPEGYDVVGVDLLEAVQEHR